MIVSAVLLSLIVFGQTADTHEGKNFLQNTGWFIGYDPTIATPFPSPEFHDEGYKQPIFKFTDVTTTADRDSWIPEHTDFHRDLQCTGKIDVEIIDTYDRYLTTLKRTTSVNGQGGFCIGFWFFKTCYNFGFGYSAYSYQMQERITTMKRGLIQAHAKCGLYWGQVLLDDLPHFQPGFLQAVKELPESYDPEDPEDPEDLEPFFSFFRKYGTHFISKVYLGSEIGKFFEVSQDSLKTVRDDIRKYTSWGSMKLWGFGSHFKVNGSGGDESEGSAVKFVKKQSYSEMSYSRGVPIPQSDNMLEWMNKSEQEPSPIKIELASISATFKAIHKRGLIGDFDLISKVEAFEHAVEDYFKLRENNAQSGDIIEPLGPHQAHVNPDQSMGYCAFCRTCGGKYPMEGGYMDHKGSDFWGFGSQCAGESAHLKDQGDHHLCCTRPSYERQGNCRYVFLEDHFRNEIQNQRLTLQGSVKVKGNPKVFPLTGLGYQSERYHQHQIGLACSQKLCSLCNSCGGEWPYMQSGYWENWEVNSRGAQCSGQIQKNQVERGARLCCRNSELSQSYLETGRL